IVFLGAVGGSVVIAFSEAEAQYRQTQPNRATIQAPAQRPRVVPQQVFRPAPIVRPNASATQLPAGRPAAPGTTSGSNVIPRNVQASQPNTHPAPNPFVGTLTGPRPASGPSSSTTTPSSASQNPFSGVLGKPSVGPTPSQSGAHAPSGTTIPVPNNTASN